MGGKSQRVVDYRTAVLPVAAAGSGETEALQEFQER